MDTIPNLTLAIADKQIRSVLERLVAVSPISIMITDANGRVLGVNQAHYELTGLSSHRLVTELKANLRRYLESVNPRVAEVFERAYQGEAVEMREAFFRMDPRPGLPMLSEKLSRGFWVDAQVFPIKDEEDRVRFVVVFLQDKTVQKELEQVLSAAHKMEMIGTLAGGVAHDVNDILAGIMGYASLLAGPVVPDDERRDVVARLLEVTRRGAELTRHMLTVARKSIPDRQMVDLVALVDALAQQQGPLFSPLHRIECRHQGPLPVTAIDRLQIERVILNLVQNAADAMPEGGTITLATTCETVDAWSSGRLPDMPSGNYVMVSVSDHGIGMSIENQGRIFEPFFSTKGVDGRVGLGLAIAYGIVKSHQGFITLQSAPGLGSTFSVWLPVEAADDLNRVAGDGQEPANEMPAMTILVVDDDPMVREVLGRMVRAMGHEGILVDGAEAALVALEQDGPKIDLVMSDVLMPGLSGLDLIEVLRRAWPTMPVLLCTGAEAPEMHQKLRHWRGVTLLPKPFAAETLRRSLERLMTWKANMDGERAR